MRKIDMENMANIDLAKLVENLSDADLENISDENASVEPEENPDENISEEQNKNTETDKEFSEPIDNIDDTVDEETLYDSDTIKVLVQDYKELKNKYDELNDKYIRTMADFGNFRKRNLAENRQKIEKSKVALLKEIITINDTFDRAIKDAKSNESFENLLEGVKAIQKIVEYTLQKENVHPIETENQKFNPELHDCILVVPVPGTEKETIIEEAEKGYILNKTVIRPSKVVVAGGSNDTPVAKTQDEKSDTESDKNESQTENTEKISEETNVQETENITDTPDSSENHNAEEETEIPVNVIKTAEEN